MTIVLTIGSFPNGAIKLSGFSQFWLRYVHGFSPHFHCQKSLRGFNDARFGRDMGIGRSFELLERPADEYIYLCGVTARANPGVHLALMAEPGASAEALTYNGIVIRVSGA